MGNTSVRSGTAVTEPEQGPETVRPGTTGPGQRRYFLMRDGSLNVRELTAEPGTGAHIPAPRGGRELDPDEGAELLARNRRVREEERAAIKREAAEQRTADYDALLALGLPERTAARMSGHTPKDGP